MNSKDNNISILQDELLTLRQKLDEANETIDAIRTGQVDALIVDDGSGHQIFTLTSADQGYRALIENMGEGAVTMSRTGLVLYCNSTFAEMLGVSLSSVIGLPFEKFVSGNSLQFYKDLFERSWDIDCKGEVELTSNHLIVPVQLSFTTLELPEGTSLSLIITDLSKQKRLLVELEKKNRQLADLNEELETSNRDLLQFASVASHDLQEPLRKIQIFSNLVKEKDFPQLSDASRVYMDKIIRSSVRMKMLIIDLLNYSKLSDNDSVPEKVDLNDIIDHVLTDLELVVSEKTAIVHVDPLPVVAANSPQMRQVFQNILFNALKFSTPGVPPIVSIKGTRVSKKSFNSDPDEDGPYVLISVKDNGIGFNEKYANNIFTLFERLNSKNDYEGTGIGLAITKKIIEKYNGLITARSKEGQGSNFMFLLPVSHLDT
jgi:PAS domain S-box-containing protein